MTPTAYLTPAQAAARFGLTRGYVAQLAKTGLIPGAVQVGRHWNIPATWQYVPAPQGWPKGKPRGTRRPPAT